MNTAVTKPSQVNVEGQAVILHLDWTFFAVRPFVAIFVMVLIVN